MTKLSESFSERELEILKALADGLSNHEIADKLFLAPNTVKWYVRQLNSKLDTNNRDEIIEAAQGMGLLNQEKPSVTPIPHNLPYQSSPFVGRDAELDELRLMLEKPDIRLLTILAQGGMGKTRIALEAAEQQLNAFTNGVFFVPLQPLTDISQIIAHLANCTGYQMQADDKRSNKAQVLDFLANKTMLLLIDNWEHLLDGAGIISEILQAAPDVKVLATSREKLNLSGETVYHLRGMHFPDWESPEDALEYDAVRLLVQAAARIKPDFAITQANLDFVSRICRLTEGMPLGILLAVAWLDVLSLEEIAAEIQKSVDFLETNMRDVPERQRSIRAIFEAAWKRLDVLERSVFMKMAVFRAGCSRQAAEGITGANLRILQSLANKALIIRRKDERFEIHELLRQYAENELNSAGQAEATYDAHADYYAAAMQSRESWLGGGRQLEALEDIGLDFENVRVAWHWVIARRNWHRLDQMLNSLSRYCSMKGFFNEGKGLVGLALEALAERSDASEKLIWAKLISRLADFDSLIAVSTISVSDLETALAIVRESGQAYDIALAMRSLGGVLETEGKIERAWELMEEMLLVSRASQNVYHEIQAMLMLAFLAGARRNEMTLFEHYCLEGIRLSRESGDIFMLSINLCNYALYSVTIGDNETAQKYYEEALALRQEIGSIPLLLNVFANFAAFSAEQSNFAKAQEFAERSMDMARHTNSRPHMFTALYTQGYVFIMQGEFEQVRQALEVALQTAHRDLDEKTIAETQMLLGMAYCGLGHYEDAAKLVYGSLATILKSSQNFRVVECLFTISLVFAWHEQAPEKALELAACVVAQPVAIFWKANPLVPRLLEHLQAEVSPELYAAIWERGKAMDLYVIANQILEEIAMK